MSVNKDEIIFYFIIKRDEYFMLGLLIKPNFIERDLLIDDS